jgi:hypothetical protein
MPVVPIDGTDGPAEVAAIKAAFPLSTAQCRALKNLMAGQSMTQAAIGAGVCRATLYKWLNDDAHFRAAHNAWKRDTLAAAHSSVLALTEPAIRAVASALDAGDAKTGVMVLKSLGVLSPQPTGAITAAEVRKERQLEKKVREKEHRSAEWDADLPV